MAFLVSTMVETPLTPKPPHTKPLTLCTECLWSRRERGWLTAICSGDPSLRLGASRRGFWSRSGLRKA